MTCQICQGRLHVRIAGTDTYERCACFHRVVSKGYIQLQIRGKDETPDPVEPFPLTNVFFCEPTNRTFRHRVWRSLLEYQRDDLVYAYLDTYRLVEIFFNRDIEYPAILDVQELPLVILVGGISEVKNSYLGQVLVQTARTRDERGLPTWVYMPSWQFFRDFYGPAVEYFSPLKVVNAPTPTLPPPPGPNEESVEPTHRGRANVALFP